jgi:hypothetical protein
MRPREEPVSVRASTDGRRRLDALPVSTISSYETAKQQMTSPNTTQIVLRPTTLCFARSPLTT